MADVTSMNEEDWGPWQSEVPPEGSIFILHLGPDYSIPSVKDGQFRYKLIRMSGNELILEQWENSRWYGGHSWGTGSKPTFRLLKGSASAKVAAANGYHCKKCHNHFPFAEPNQPDGTLVCWGCRNYPHYHGRLA